MKIHEIKELLSAKLLYGEELLSTDVYSACASDMMSDVLAFVKDQGVLLTGLVNPQVMRCVVLVRGKKATPEMTELAESISIVLMESDMRMYDACGRLFSAGLVGASVQ